MFYSDGGVDILDVINKAVLCTFATSLSTAPALLHSSAPSKSLQSSSGAPHVFPDNSLASYRKYLFILVRSFFTVAPTLFFVVRL